MAGLIVVPKHFLLFAGLWTLHLNQSTVFTIIYKFYSALNKVIYVSFVATLVAQFIILLIKHDNRERIISSLAILIIIFENATKFIIYQKNNIPQMFEEIIKFESAIMASRDVEITILYRKQVRFCRIINILHIIAILTATGTFTLFSFMDYAADGTKAFENQPFMHDIWYPFDMTNHMDFVIFLQMYYLIFGGCINIATLTTLASMNIFVGMRLRMLQIRVKRTVKMRQDQSEDNVEAAVKDLIREHQHVISFVDLLNEKTKYMMLMDFLLKSINLASALVQCLTATDVAGVIYPASLLFLVLLEIFAVAWVANDVKLQSMSVANAVYNSGWYEQSKKIETLLHVMLMRAQVPLLFTIGPFGPMTNETALTMVKAAYTYVTIMMDSYK